MTVIDGHSKVILVQVVVDHEFESIDEWSQAFKYQLIGRIMHGQLTHYYEVVKKLNAYDE